MPRVTKPRNILVSLALLSQRLLYRGYILSISRKAIIRHTSLNFFLALCHAVYFPELRDWLCLPSYVVRKYSRGQMQKLASTGCHISRLLYILRIRCKRCLEKKKKTFSIKISQSSYGIENRRNFSK